MISTTTRFDRACLRAAAALSFALTACSGSDDPSDAPAAAGSNSAGGAGSSGGTSSAADGDVAGGSNSAGSDSAGSDSGGSDSGGGSAGDGSTLVELPERVARYLRDASPRLVVEIDSVSGLEPYADSAPYLESLLHGLVDKSEGISFEADETLEPFGSDYEWTFERLRAFAEEHAESDDEGPVRIHVLSLDGRYVREGQEGTVLGLAWSNRYVALFQYAIRGRCESGLLGGLNREVCEIAERSVWAHELGHVLGLVDAGIPMVNDHRDPDHGRHEVREGCLMYWAYEGAQIFDTLLERIDAGESELDFCEDSRLDVEMAK